MCNAIVPREIQILISVNAELSRTVGSFFLTNFKYSALSSPLHGVIRVQLFLHGKLMKHHHSIPITES